MLFLLFISNGLHGTGNKSPGRVTNKKNLPKQVKYFHSFFLPFIHLM